MSEVKLVIRDAHEDRSGRVHGSVADWFIAALSADPMSIAELDAAVDRFAVDSPAHGHLSHFSHSLDAEPWDAGLVVIDLAARLVVFNSTYSTYKRVGAVVRYDIQPAEGRTVLLGYRLADDWMFQSDELVVSGEAAKYWESTARRRRQERADQPEVDLREIFYGEPMLRFVINGCRQQFSRRDEIAERVRLARIEREDNRNEQFAKESQPDPEPLTMHDLARESESKEEIEYKIYYNTIRDIHADWLMTPCQELNHQLPRSVMLRDHDRLHNDMNDREHQWSSLEQCPPGISPESHAFQFSGFNTNEIVMYYEYVRTVAWNCWDRLRTMSHGDLDALACSPTKLDEFTPAEVIRLREVGEAWLDSPWEDDPTRTPRGIINLERRRQPNGGKFQPIDPDCPCCQAMAELPGIGFWHMDGCNMDDLFAFAFHHDTIESWEEEQREQREFSEQMNRQWKLAQEWNLPPQFSASPGELAEVWRLVVKVPDGEVPLGRRLTSIGHALVSLIMQFRVAAEHGSGIAVEPYMQSLHYGFTKMRQACEKSNAQEISPDVEVSATWLMSVLDDLISDASSYLDNETSVDENGKAKWDAGESETENNLNAGVVQSSMHDSRWRKVVHHSQELRQALLSSTNVVEEELSGGWFADDTPF